MYFVLLSGTCGDSLASQVSGVDGKCRLIGMWADSVERMLNLGVWVHEALCCYMYYSSSSASLLGSDNTDVDPRTWIQQRRQMWIQRSRFNDMDPTAWTQRCQGAWIQLPLPWKGGASIVNGLRDTCSLSTIVRMMWCSASCHHFDINKHRNY